MKYIDRILDLKDKYDVFAFDMWGTVWSGGEFFDGIEDILIELNRDKKVIIISNNPRQEFKSENDFGKKGFIKGKHYDEIYSSGGLFLKEFIKGNDSKIFNMYPPEDKFEEYSPNYVDNPEEADYIHIGMPMIDGKLQMNMDLIEEKIEEIIKYNKPMLCSNPDLTAPLNAFKNGHRLYAIMPGMIAKRYIELGGKVQYFGKPYNNIFKYAISEDLKSKTIMIGDTIGTDIKGGQDAGIDTLFVQTGVSSSNARELGYSDIKDYIKDKGNGVKPTYILTNKHHY